MFLSVDFGASYASLAHVGYTQKKADGSDALARTETGVVEIGNGCYGVEVTPAADAVFVLWDTNTGATAGESITTNANVKKVNDVTIVGDGVGTPMGA